MNQTGYHKLMQKLTGAQFRRSDDRANTNTDSGAALAITPA